jgi:ribosomal protein S1
MDLSTLQTFHGHVSTTNEVVELDQTLNVVILDFDEDKSRIQWVLNN